MLDIVHQTRIIINRRYANDRKKGNTEREDPSKIYPDPEEAAREASVSGRADRIESAPHNCDVIPEQQLTQKGAFYT